MNSRISRLRNALEKKDIESIILFNPANISYLAGFPVEDSYIFLDNKEALLITDSRYSKEYRKILNSKEISIVEIKKSLLHTLKKLKIKKLAFEQKHVSFYLYQKLKALFEDKLTPASDIVEELRMIKEKGELESIKKAVGITLETFEYIEKILEPGIREIEVAAEIERYIRYKGSTGTAFNTIVASGPNSSFPHAKITQRKIRKNEPIMIDLGLDFQGYKSDLTRVFFLGKMNPLFKKVYGIVEVALERAKKTIKPGIPINYIDKQAREFIKDKGFGHCFKHSLGHGIGLEVHEQPRISFQNKESLKSGMVFTLEPAIYIDNKFGVRLEEMVLVTDKKAEVLSGS
ncbi:MAG: Xaa-Pro peptidase family protein [Candidatus Omnitrophica bacterium]|nr:Xaa-Pro peptidase family protein [Candidatus Omnitrophota bacterium]